MSYQAVKIGEKFSLSYRVYIKCLESGSLVSPFHDIPMLNNIQNGLFNMFVEIPRWTNAKMEIATADSLNPIKQDVKNSKPRFVHNIFPFCGYPWNYGAIPQTWEDPTVKDHHTGFVGDNDPIDVIDVGDRRWPSGSVVPIKVLGCIALIDEGETDWKIISVAKGDSNFDKLNSIEDLRMTKPGLLEATIDWFRKYKVPAGKGENKFAFEGQAKEAEFARQIVFETHEAWKSLVSLKTASCLSVKGVVADDCVQRYTKEEVKAIQDNCVQMSVSDCFDTTQPIESMDTVYV